MTALPETLATTPDLSELGPLYQDYAYGYPHKSAYRTFTPKLRLGDLWREERKDSLFLYLHLPFCEMRCGFCNLFTTANPAADMQSAYLDALERQIAAVRAEVGAFRPAQMALGGGTPTLLPTQMLARVFDLLAHEMGGDPASISAGIETSPQTATPDRIALLAERGFERISMGVQSFHEAETRAMGRPQAPSEVIRALETIRGHSFPRLNLDLIYGAANQTPASWLESLRMTLRWQPEEVFLYPLYIRARTGLDGRTSVEDEHRRRLYRAGRDFLLEHGYRQVSMRAFHRIAADGPPADNEFSCQEDGVIGLGTGARSYTSKAHYSSRYAVSRRGVLGIIDDYCAQSIDDFRFVDHGILMDRGEAMRRFLLKSILRSDGLDRTRFEEVFGADAEGEFPALTRLVELGLLRADNERLQPTALGLEHSDAIPPLFYSSNVRTLMASGPPG